MKAWCLSMAAVVLVACSSSTAPQDRITVALAGPATAQGFLTTVNGNSVYRCDVSMTATASGGNAGDVATWQGGHTRFTHFDGTFSDQSYTDAQRFFDGNPTSLATGTTLRGSDDYFYTGTQRPFSVRVVLYYSAPRVNRDSASYDLACQ